MSAPYISKNRRGYWAASNSGMSCPMDSTTRTPTKPERTAMKNKTGLKSIKSCNYVSNICNAKTIFSLLPPSHLEKVVDWASKKLTRTVQNWRPTIRNNFSMQQRCAFMILIKAWPIMKRLTLSGRVTSSWILYARGYESLKDSLLWPAAMNKERSG